MSFKTYFIAALLVLAGGQLAAQQLDPLHSIRVDVVYLASDYLEQ